MPSLLLAADFGWALMPFSIGLKEDGIGDGDNDMAGADDDQVDGCDDRGADRPSCSVTVKFS